MVDSELGQQKEKGQNGIRAFGFVISVVVCVLLCVVFAGNPVGSRQSCGRGLEGRINPNIASVASLVRLPGIGPGRATAIINYRSEFSKREPNTPAFGDCNDLQNVRGIGPKTVQNINRWLKFE